MDMRPLILINCMGDFMNTKYNKEIDDKYIIIYFERLIPKLYKIMPMKESNDVNLGLYIYKLINQLCGGKNLIVDDSLFVEIIFNLESLQGIQDIRLHNSIVKENISMCQKIISKLKKGDDVNGV